MSISTALEARRDGLRDREAGFTLIELLVVVIIIGILAAIAIPIYLGVQNNAKETATKSDLTNDKTAITGYAVDTNGNIPASITDDATGTVGTGASAVSLVKYGWSKTTTNTNTLTYTKQAGATSTSDTWCLEGLSATGNKFRISTNTAVAKGTCTGTGGLGTGNF